MAYTSAMGRTAGLSSARKPSLMGLLALYRQRHALARLDDAALLDIGLTRAEALAEAKRPIWDVPKTWVQC
ncbi:DUF1127 domain-containing protein [Shimia sp. SDUM112013]|uniref:DUF1127 domain-containing protein n=1 Tax=Shimia sp. SDUM112013 TaxID=3136160 RepID=UPI0032EF48CF